MDLTNAPVPSAAAAPTPTAKAATPVVPRGFQLLAGPVGEQRPATPPAVCPGCQTQTG